MTILESDKAKPIDTYLQDGRKPGDQYGYEDAIPDSAAWPEGEQKKIHEREEDLYGYGDAAPTPRNPAMRDRMPRRSSLKSANACPRRASISYTGEMTLTLPTGEKKQKRTSISFNDDSEVQDIKPLSNMVEDPNRLWFQKDEYKHIQKKIYAIVNEAKNGETDDRATWLCTRGLEPLMSAAGHMERREAYDSVIEEQYVQKSQGRFDDEFIRTIYQFHTVDSQIVAAERAEEDAKAVESYLKLTRKMCRRMSC